MLVLFSSSRLRLREEVEVLKHLSQVAGAEGYGTQVQTRSQAHPAALGRHPNVLGYIDSWEEDETLFIQTELCDSGNFAHFLWEYGKSYPKLDEERVWKILADLSDVCHFFSPSPSPYHCPFSSLYGILTPHALFTFVSLLDF